MRFNLKRGGSEGVEQLGSFARRVYEVVGWHSELYLDSKDLQELYPLLRTLPAISIDHRGLSQAGYYDLLRLVEQGGHVKASGFSRVDFDVRTAIQQIAAINPEALLFGTDLPSTRAPAPYRDEDLQLVIDVLEESTARKVLYENAVRLYRPKSVNLPNG